MGMWLTKQWLCNLKSYIIREPSNVMYIINNRQSLVTKLVITKGYNLTQYFFNGGKF